MPNERILCMNQRLAEIEAGEILSPAESAILDLCKTIVNELQMLDAELSMMNDSDAPIGCADDTEYELSDALKRLGPERLKELLSEKLNRG